MQVSDLQVCVKSRGVGRAVLWDSVRLNFLSLRRLSAGMILKIQIDSSSQCKWAYNDFSCYMLDLVHFACKLNICLPESYLPVISVRIWKDVHARAGPEATHRPGFRPLWFSKLEGACRQGPVCELAQGEGLLLGVALGCVSKALGWGGAGYCSLQRGPISIFY